MLLSFENYYEVENQLYENQVLIKLLEEKDRQIALLEETLSLAQNFARDAVSEKYQVSKINDNLEAKIKELEKVNEEIRANYCEISKRLEEKENQLLILSFEYSSQLKELEKVNKALELKSHIYEYTEFFWTGEHNVFRKGNFKNIDINESIELINKSQGSYKSRLSSKKRIQDDNFKVSFDFKIDGEADGTTFNVGGNLEDWDEGPNTPGYSLAFQVYNEDKPRGIYLYDNLGKLVATYLMDFSNEWNNIIIEYTDMSWNIYYNSKLIITHQYDKSWVKTSGSYYGFGSRNGGKCHTFQFKNFTLE